ncbi:MAG TPA: hypothetical protein VHQ22_09095 [Terriglobales bacterium]|jgi:hypothetical protein|nr:hypothetical protein [Terriglobales bacterium]
MSLERFRRAKMIVLNERSLAYQAARAMKTGGSVIPARKSTTRRAGCGQIARLNAS